MIDIPLFAVVQLFMLVGLLGLIVPIFPGMLIMWLSALAYGIFSGFSTLGIILFVFITLLTIVGSLVDNVLMGVGARKGGASWWSIGAAVVAGVLGTIIFPPLGGIIAAPLTVLLLEYRRIRDWDKSWQALRGLATGWGLSFLARFGIGMVMMVLWWIWAWKG